MRDPTLPVLHVHIEGFSDGARFAAYSCNVPWIIGQGATPDEAEDDFITKMNFYAPTRVTVH